MAEDVKTRLRRRIARAPTDPGIYRWLDDQGVVIYVGKAKNLRNRLRSYVLDGARKDAGPWKRSFLDQIVDFDVTIVNSEVEALVLEANLIKQLKPRYNVMMKDDKNYVYVKITHEDPFPAVDIVRKIDDPPTSSASGGLRGAGKAKFFGPFLSKYDTNRTLDMLHELFGFRACRASLDALNRAKGDAEAVYDTGKLRPCLDFQIGRCCGTCAGAISKEEYRARIASIINFFKGNYDFVIDRARELMHNVAEQKKFEKAAEIRDMIQLIEGMKEKQIVSDTSGDNADIIGIALLSGKVQVVLMQKRLGRLIGEQSLSLRGSADSLADVLEQFLPQYYDDVPDLPDEVILGEDFPSRDAFAAFMSERHGKKVSVIVPERGNKSKLLELAERNAHEKAKQAEASWEAEKRNTEQALDDLQQILGLPHEIKRIEGYDISHTGGTETVGSMVVFVDGKPKNDHYRSFTIHSIASGVIDDYRSLKEVLTRRVRHLVGGLKFEEKKWNENGITFGKAKKDEQTFIEERINSLQHIFDLDGISYKDFFVARDENQIVAFCRLFLFPGNIKALRSLYVDESYRGSRLGQFLTRKVLHTQKKGKVYAIIDPVHEQYYAEVGFRYVLKPPALLQERVAKDRADDPSGPEWTVVVYDAAQNKNDSSFSTKPDLFVIDGGKGQLSTVVEVLKAFEIDIPVIGLAKREEEVFVPDQSDPIPFPPDSPAKFLLMRLRDEAHRFANKHRSKRAYKTMTKSQLDRIPSIGPEKKKELLAQFGSTDAVRRAPDEVLRQHLTTEQIAMIRSIL